MRDKEAGQSFGDQLELCPLTEDAYQTFVRFHLGARVPATLKDFWRKQSADTHYALVRRAGERFWRFAGVGPPTRLRPQGQAARWAKPVTSFDSPEALQWGRLADSEVYVYPRKNVLP